MFELKTNPPLAISPQTPSPFHIRTHSLLSSADVPPPLMSKGKADASNDVPDENGAEDGTATWFGTEGQRLRLALKRKPAILQLQKELGMVDSLGNILTK